LRAAEPIKGALRLVGRVVPRKPGRRVVVLCYHSVHPSLPFSSASPQLFAEHLAWLSENCRCVPFDEILSVRLGPESPLPVVAITFDDGYADNHEFALPLLVDHGIEATFFLTAGLVDRDRRTIERFKYLRNVDEEMIRPLQWTQVAEMLQAGMQIGAHSYTHPNLAGLDGSELAYEVAHSKRIVEDRIGHDISTMAYPFGRPKVHVTQPVLEAVRRAGFGFACTTVTRGVQARDQPLGIPRFIATQNPVEVLREKVLGTWDLVGTLRERAPLKIARMVSPIDFEF
jgi:peptidoglycan/xylan/chitin deacetylase (PgdA/CDA1 family)